MQSGQVTSQSCRTAKGSGPFPYAAGRWALPSRAAAQLQRLSLTWTRRSSPGRARGHSRRRLTGMASSAGLRCASAPSRSSPSAWPGEATTGWSERATMSALSAADGRRTKWHGSSAESLTRTIVPHLYCEAPRCDRRHRDPACGGRRPLHRAAWISMPTVRPRPTTSATSPPSGVTGWPVASPAATRWPTCRCLS